MKIRDLLLWAGCVSAATPGSALTLGASQGQAVLGAPLDLSFHVRPDAGLTAEHSCISAAIRMGDTLVPDSAINVLFNGSDRVRVRVRQPVNEPVVSVQLLAGCNGSVARTYTFFADPPIELAHTPAPLNLGAVPTTTTAATSQPALAVAVASASVVEAPAPAAAPAPARRTATPRAERAAPPPSAPRPRPKPVAKPAPVPEPTADAVTAAPPPPAPPQIAPPPPPSPPPAEAKPTLRIEPLQGQSTPLAPTDQPFDIQPALAPASSIPSTDDRMAQLEAQLKLLVTQQQKDRDQVLSLQSQLQQAQERGLPAWVNALIGLLGLSLASVAWLVHRLRAERANTQRAWQATVAATPTPEAPAAAPGLQVPHTETAAPLTASAAAPIAPPAPVPQTLDAKASGAPSAHQDLAVVSSQALLEVQEQAEFFASVGQHDEAIALLQAHLREHQGASPLAYIELLRIYYRLSRSEAYARTRDEFAAQFNVQVPAFAQFEDKGRDLYSGYPEVLAEIEAQWPTDAVLAHLRQLMLRTPDTPADTLRLDLAALDDVLLLYHVARTTPCEQRGPLPGRVRTTPTISPPQAHLPALALAATTQTVDVAGPGNATASAAIAAASALHLEAEAPVDAPLTHPPEAPAEASALKLAAIFAQIGDLTTTDASQTEDTPLATTSPQPAATAALMQDLELELIAPDATSWAPAPAPDSAPPQVPTSEQLPMLNLDDFLTSTSAQPSAPDAATPPLPTPEDFPDFDFDLQPPAPSPRP